LSNKKSYIEEGEGGRERERGGGREGERESIKN